MRYLVTGGVKSGKSTRALELAASFAEPRSFLATALAFDDEMRAKIARHRDERRGAFDTVEEPYRIDVAVRENMIVDCVPMWLNNMFFSERENEIDEVLASFLERLPANVVIVTNETGWGVIPADALSRRYGERLGRVNAALARAADVVELMVAGIPVRIKGA